MSFLTPLAKPPTLLGYHQVLSPTAGVRVSPLCLGAMNFGEKWKDFLGECNKDTAFAMLDTFFKSGGNFIDTANAYQGEDSEVWLGEWMAARGVRDQIVLATKFTSSYPSQKDIGVLANYAGNHKKSLNLSVEASLKKLKTSYIDLLYLHWWDFTTSIPELMHSLHHLIISGKVLYIGISDTPAWVVAKANEYARGNRLTPFCVYQGHWSASVRDFERDILPMCLDEGMAVAPWGSLGRGLYRSAEEWEKSRAEGRKTVQQDDASRAVSAALGAIARRKGTRMTSVALAYVRAKYPYVFPIVGGRSVEQLTQNIDALSVELSEQEVDEIEAATPAFDIGFPMSMLFGMRGDRYSSRFTSANVTLLRSSTNLDVPSRVQPPRPHKADDVSGEKI